MPTVQAKQDAHKAADIVNDLDEYGAGSEEHEIQSATAALTAQLRSLIQTRSPSPKTAPATPSRHKTPAAQTPGKSKQTTVAELGDGTTGHACHGCTRPATGLWDIWTDRPDGSTLHPGALWLCAGHAHALGHEPDIRTTRRQ